MNSGYSSSDCRICLKNAGILPIFGDLHKPDISIEILEFGCIQLKKEDEFSKFICEDCFKLLEGAITFRKCARRSEGILKRLKKKREASYFQNSVVKIETETASTSNYTEAIHDLWKPQIDLVSIKDTENLQECLTVKYESSLKDGQISTHFMSDDNIDNKVEIENETDEIEILILSGNEKKPEAENFPCKYCKLAFEVEEEYEQHRNTIAHKRNYVISFLPKNKSQTDKKTVNPKDRKCDICNRFFTKLHYPRHMQTEHNIKMETSRSKTKKICPVCKRMFNPVSLVRHLKKVHGDGKDLPPKIKFECPICNKWFSKDYYPLHLQRHKQGDARNYICDQCGKKFFFKSSFCTHRLIHTNDLPHKCEYCPYRGRTKDLLKIHVRTHTGDYPYKCTQCDARCLTKSNLNSHMRRHRGPVDFVCDTCSRGFYTKLQLERHISVNHYGIKNFVCSLCGVAFGYRHGLMNHQRKVHKRPKGTGKPKAVYLQLEEENQQLHQFQA